jgi:uncharacterized protein YlxW (UPF0749 family)
MRAFQAAAQQKDNDSSLLAPWRARVAELEEDNRMLRHRNADLQATVQAYAEAIADFSAAIESSPPRTLAPVRPIRS